MNFILSILSNVSLFSWLDRIPFWSALSYARKGSLLRVGKGALSAVIGVLIGAVTDGTLLPKGTGGLTIIIVTGVLQGLDKFIREWQITKETESAHADIPITDTVPVLPVPVPDPVIPDPVAPAADDADPTVFDDPIDPSL